MKNKTTAGVLAILLGGLGLHKFYLNRPLQGVIYFLMAWTFIPAAIGFIEGVMYLLMSDESFNAKYNTGLLLAAQPQNIVVNVANTATAGGVDVSGRLRSLQELKTSGALTDAEFDSEKQKLLALS